jgi:predicted transcriptional regulator
MDCVWSHGPLSADDCRKRLRASWPMKDSTVRTVLLRLERKGYVTHAVEGRAFIYRAAENQLSVAARAVRHIIQKFCGGSAEELVIGLVDHDVLTPPQLRRLVQTIAERKKAGK